MEVKKVIVIRDDMSIPDMSEEGDISCPEWEDGDDDDVDCALVKSAIGDVI